MAVVGPTGSGKSELAMAVAERIGAEILSVDSMQVYREMDIGTAKPPAEDRKRVRHHMIDVASPEETYTVARFRHEARSALETSTAPVVLLVGGSGLHFRSVVDPMRFRPGDSGVRRDLESIDPGALVEELVGADPRAGERVDLANPRRVRRAVEAWRVGGVTPTQWAESPAGEEYGEYRPELDFRGLAVDRSDIETAVGRRLQNMRRKGFLAEVEALAPRLGTTASQAVGYRELLRVISGQMTEEEGFDAARRATLKLVKRQRTFFRRDPRLRWYDAEQSNLVDVVLREAGL